MGRVATATLAGVRFSRGATEGLKGRILSGSMWTLLGYASVQVLRFVSNAVLTHLLFPEAFGLMTLVNTVLMGLEMLSDVGTRASLIQNKHGEDASYLRTAFTINVLRGGLLWLSAGLLAYPLSVVFEQPELARLLPVAAMSACILGFRSTKVLLASRKLNLGRITLLNLSAQVLATAVMIPWAYWSSSIWPLVAGTLVAALANTVGSHVLFPGQRDRFGWNRSAAREMFRFGRWIFVSTALAYLAGRGDTLLMGRLLDARQLGVFAVASNLAGVAGEALNQLGNSVLFPAYAKVFREEPRRVNQVLRKSRGILMGIGAVAYVGLILLGDFVVQQVYDDRYHAAGWILQTLACGFMTGLLDRSYGGVLHAKGLSLESTVLQFFQVLIKFGCLWLGYHFLGFTGVVLGVAFNAWLSYPVVAVVMARAGVWQPRLDACALAIAAVTTVVYWVFAPVPGL